MMKLLIITLMSIMTSIAYATDEYAQQHHQQMINQHHAVALTEAGNDVFGTIQEIISKLESHSDTDWSKVDIEALKEHLLDMRDMTMNVNVISQKKLKNGSEILIQPTTNRSMQAMERILLAHPVQLNKETNWQMKVKKQGDKYLLTTTTDTAAEVNKIIGLGYIGLMAYGNHHQPHHWLIATGGNPHFH